jgi:hypothetical protein
VAKKVDRKRVLFGLLFVALIMLTVAARYFLFAEGYLYGEATAKMASLAVAGIIIVAGFLPLKMLGPTKKSGESQKPSETSTESIAAVLAAILGLALTAYSVSELLAPNTPVAASVAACSGTPVYGARYFAKTQPIGANARSGVGVQYPQLTRFGGNCTLGFDGYCVGPPVPDYILSTPDQRWLIVRDRSELVAAGVVLAESPESDLGDQPSPQCKKLGGLAQPSIISKFSYNTASGQLSAIAPGAYMVGYGMAEIKPRRYQTVALSDASRFADNLSSATISNEMIGNGKIWLGAVICLAYNVPVTGSLQVRQLRLSDSRVVGDQVETRIPDTIKSLLAGVACNSPLA